MKFKRILGNALKLVTVFNMFLIGTPTIGYSEGSSLIQAAGEIFLKGSLDGEHLYFVLGIQEGFENTKDILRWAVKGEDLIDTASSVYNSAHNDDFVDSAVSGIIKTGEFAQNIVNAPWRTLKSIPQSFQVRFDRASQAYYSSNSVTVGGLKWSGLAVWAVIRGVLCLVVEAGAEFGGYSAMTLLATPSYLLEQTFTVVCKSFKVLFKYTAGAIATLAINSYSFVSAVSATLGTLLIGGVVAVTRGAFWLAYSGPRSIFYPLKESWLTKYSADYQFKVAQAYDQYLKKLSSQFSIKSKIRKVASVIKITSISDKKTWGYLYLYPKKGLLKIKVELSRRFCRTDEQRTNLKAQLNVWATEVDQILTPSLAQSF